MPDTRVLAYISLLAFSNSVVDRNVGTKWSSENRLECKSLMLCMRQREQQEIFQSPLIPYVCQTCWTGSLIASNKSAMLQYCNSQEWIIYRPCSSLFSSLKKKPPYFSTRTLFPHSFVSKWQQLLKLVQYCPKVLQLAAEKQGCNVILPDNFASPLCIH